MLFLLDVCEPEFEQTDSLSEQVSICIAVHVIFLVDILVRGLRLELILA